MPTAIGKLILVLSCLACAGQGKKAVAHVSNVEKKAELSRELNSLSALATLLLTSDQDLAFNPSGSLLVNSRSANPSVLALDDKAPSTKIQGLRSSRIPNMMSVAAPPAHKEKSFSSHPFDEAWISDEAASLDPVTGLSRGLSVVCLENVVSRDERRAMVEASVLAAQEYTENRPSHPGKVSEMLAFACSDDDKNVDPYAFDQMWMLACKTGLVDFGETSSEGKGLVRLQGHDIPSVADKLMRETILPRVFKIIDARFPSLVKNLFDGATSLLHLYSTTLEEEPLPFSAGNQEEKSQLEFAFQEPGINVYTAGGKFKSHSDKQALTVLIPLSEDDAFTEGGTGYWIHGQDPDETPPNLKLRPPAGTAMLWVGNVTHTGIKINSGERVVLVASFTRRLTDRLKILDGAIEKEQNLQAMYTQSLDGAIEKEQNMQALR